MANAAKLKCEVVPSRSVGANFGKFLKRVKKERRSLVIEDGGTPSAVLISIQDYIRLAAPEPEILTLIGERAKANGTDKLSSEEIDDIVKEARLIRKSKRK